MDPVQASAPAKAILLGEHAVVYGNLALAVPIAGLRATASISRPQNAISRITASAIDLDLEFSALDPAHPFRLIIDAVLKDAALAELPPMHLHIQSAIPFAAGLGSGAAVSVAIIRALAAWLGLTLSDHQVSQYAFQAEKIYHGNPSGLDNTVIAHEKCVAFRRDHPLSILVPLAPLHLVIADTGVPSVTRAVVGWVREQFELEPAAINAIWAEIDQISIRGVTSMLAGNLPELGKLMDHNHALLQQLGVSCPELDHLVHAARASGALGAKLSGAGWGGHIVALVMPEQQETVSQALLAAGAVSVYRSRVQ